MKVRLNEHCIYEAGIDEAGRGCLAGPVVAAAVVLPKNFSHPNIRDSKMLSHSIRVETEAIIKEHAISWCIGTADPREIEAKNIVQATMLAMHRAISGLKVMPEHLLIDGNYFVPFQSIPYVTIVKGDSKFLSIAAASILAKVHRDRLLSEMAKDFPEYCWEQNKGYPTKHHREAIEKFGPTQHHRNTFRLLKLPEQGNLFE